MILKKVIAAFLLTILVSTFSFTYFSVPSNQFIEINEEENKHNGSSISFSMQEYLAGDALENLFFFSAEMLLFKTKITFLTFIKKVIAPPPETI
ncbi:MAG: hypothetical protein CVT95_09735 [Bacteroidetes bacterium HGW-Bacteroidetes-12]|jgi:hypothetical protein|nr:MAG: hypothetical protein CVT95_09735 [Bacteroidetes bacterium HGW-Bacteroidetes-12]